MGFIGRVVLATVCVTLCVYCSFRFKRLPDVLIPKKYTDDTALRTISSAYTVLDTDLQPCSPSTPSPHFSLPRQPMSIDDTDLLSQEGLSCQPLSYGYSLSAGSKVFPDSEFPPCHLFLPPEVPSITLHPSNNTFEIHCNRSNSPFYAILPSDMSPTALYVRDDLEEKWRVQEYKAMTDLGNSEFVYAGCNSTLTNMRISPKFKPESFNRAREIMKKRAKMDIKRPLILLLVTIDSFSRRQFYRKLPETAKFLNSLHTNSTFSVFDFKLHNSLGPNSVLNMLPVLSNTSRLQEHPIPPEDDVLGNGTLWSILKSLGYVTFFGLESCENHFPKVMGKNIDVDHSTRGFYCAAHQLMGVKADKRSTQQRCLGSDMSHVHLLNYSQTFMDLYQGVNQFLYLHIDTGHEVTGTQAGLLDADLLRFLRNVVEKQRLGSDVVMVLQGDHGMRYGKWYTEIEAFQEYKLPALFFIAENHVLDRFPGSFETLWVNSRRLISKRDLRATILSFSTLPYNETYPVHSDSYLSRDCVLHLETASPFRTCQGLGIAPLQCSCQPRVSLEVMGKQGKEIVDWIVSEALVYINGKSHTPTAFSGRNICKKAVLERVIDAFGMEITDKLEVIQVNFSVKSVVATAFEVQMAVGSARTRFILPGRGGGESLTTVYNGHPVYGRIMSLTRTQPGLNCSALLSDGQSEYCVCADPS